MHKISRGDHGSERRGVVASRALCDHAGTMRRILVVLLSVVVLPACRDNKAAEGEPCEQQSDCNQSLMCQVSPCLVPPCPAQCAKDPRCSKQPPQEFDLGPCTAIMGAYYNPEKEECWTMDGCSCDETCRRDYLPFRALEDCRQICE